MEDNANTQKQLDKVAAVDLVRAGLEKARSV